MRFWCIDVAFIARGLFLLYAFFYCAIIMIINNNNNNNLGNNDKLMPSIWIGFSCEREKSNFWNWIFMVYNYNTNFSYYIIEIQNQFWSNIFIFRYILVLFCEKVTLASIHYLSKLKAWLWNIFASSKNNEFRIIFLIQPFFISNILFIT